MRKKESNIILLSITLCWASSYIFIKDIPSSLSDFGYLTLTSGIAAIILLLVFFRRLRSLDRQTLIRSGILSVLIAGNMLMEKVGLKYISSSQASFMASLNIVFVPLILFFFKKKPSKDNLLGIIIIIIGILFSHGGFFTNGEMVYFEGTDIVGTLFMLGACILMSIYTIVATDFCKDSDPLILSVLQIAFSAIIGFILWVIEDPMTFAHVEWSDRMLSSIFILAIFSKSYAYIMLMYAERYADALSVTVIASTEPIVTFALALLIPNAEGHTEPFSLGTAIGSVIIALGAFVAGSHLIEKFFYKKKDISSKEAHEESQNKSDETPALASDSSPISGSAIKKRKTVSRFKKNVLRFLLCFIPFAILGVLFKVMTLVPGYTEVRPANSIPTVSGLLFGRIGAAACALGNTIADLFGTFDLKTLLGAAGNFLAAYIPYRMWYALYNKKPHTKTWKGILLYAWCSLVGSLAVSWILVFGLDLFFGIWIPSIGKMVLMNNFLFSICLGLPIFILARSDSIMLSLRVPRPARSKMIKKIPQKAVPFFFIISTIVFIGTHICVHYDLHLSNSTIASVLSIMGVAFLVCIFILPVKRRIKIGKKEK